MANTSNLRRLVYIMGPNYSGSTLLTRLLADHPRIVTVGELKATAMGDISVYRCSCGELLTGCPFWRKVEMAMQEKGRAFAFDNFRTHFRVAGDPVADRLLRAGLRGSLLEAVREAGFLLFPSARRVRQMVVEQNRAVIESICAIQQADIFLDDSKEPVRLKFLLAAGLWDIKVIRLIRDGRGVANSYMRHNRVPMTTAAREWIQTQKECDRMAARLGHRRCLTVHYEDLCTDPEKTMGIIHDFLELDDASARRDFSGRNEHILGNQMRLGSLREIRLDEKWKNVLSPEDLCIFHKEAGELNSLHGYS